MGVYRNRSSKILYNAYRLGCWEPYRHQWMVDAINAGQAYFEPYGVSKYRLRIVTDMGSDYAYVGDWVTQNPISKHLSTFGDDYFTNFFEKVETPSAAPERKEDVCPNQLRVFLNSLPKDFDVKISVGEYNVISLIVNGSIRIDELIAENKKLTDLLDRWEKLGHS